MALERKDNIGDTTTSTGTGTINLEAIPQIGARIFAGNVTSGATVRYDIRSNDQTEWEIGEGVFTDGTPDTLTRVTVYASSNAGLLVSFSAGTKNVSLVLTAGEIFGTNSIIANETPSGALDGVDLTYTLANSPIAGSLAVYLNGQRLTYTDDYTLATNVITFVIAPVSTDIVRADYLLAGAGSGNADTLDGQHAPTGTIVGTTDTQTLTNKTLTSPTINTPIGILKGDVGLGNVDNTSDATKNSETATLTNKTLTSPQINLKHTAGADIWSLDTASDGDYLTIANNGVISFGASANFSGLIIVQNLTSGSIAMFLTGGGAMGLVFQNGTSFSAIVSTPNKTNVILSTTPTANIVQMQNLTGGSVNYLITTIRTRSVS